MSRKSDMGRDRPIQEKSMSRKLARMQIVNWAASVIAYREFYGIGGDVTFAFACDAKKAFAQARKILKGLCKDAPPMKLRRKA